MRTPWVQNTLAFTVGWGTYKDKTQPASFDIFYRGEKPPPADSITWLGKTAQYKVQFTLEASGKWTWVDESTGATIVEGVNNELKKD